MTSRCHVLIAAAGQGTRSGLAYPKTLYPVRGEPILLRILQTLHHVDPEPSIVVSPGGRDQVEHCVTSRGSKAHFLVQQIASGMGDAVLCFQQSSIYPSVEHVLLIWGDIPLISRETIDAMTDAHFAHDNDLTFVTKEVASAYTVVRRSDDGEVVGVDETREQGSGSPKAGERDIGLFIFRKDPLFSILSQRLEGSVGRTTQEHGFLYAIEHLARQGYRVEALPIASDHDVVSLNRLSDLDGWT